MKLNWNINKKWLKQTFESQKIDSFINKIFRELEINLKIVKANHCLVLNNLKKILNEIDIDGNFDMNEKYAMLVLNSLNNKDNQIEIIFQ